MPVALLDKTDMGAGYAAFGGKRLLSKAALATRFRDPGSNFFVDSFGTLGHLLIRLGLTDVSDH